MFKSGRTSVTDEEESKPHPHRRLKGTVNKSAHGFSTTDKVVNQLHISCGSAYEIICDRLHFH